MAELSEPTSADLKETIHSIVHGLLATLSPKMHSQSQTSIGIGSSDHDHDHDVVEKEREKENTSIQFQPLVSLTRDYLARLLFWLPLFTLYIFFF